MPKIPRGSFDQALWPQALVVRALKPAVCLHGPLLLGRSSLPFASLKCPAAASTRHSGHKHFLLEPCRLPFASMVLCCYGVQACRLPTVKCLKSPAAASTRHSGHKHLLLEPCSLPFASMALHCPPWRSAEPKRLKMSRCAPSFRHPWKGVGGTRALAHL